MAAPAASMLKARRVAMPEPIPLSLAGVRSSWGSNSKDTRSQRQTMNELGRFFLFFLVQTNSSYIPRPKPHVPEWAPFTVVVAMGLSFLKINCQSWGPSFALYAMLASFFFLNNKQPKKKQKI